jgi:hypothetical protein
LKENFLSLPNTSTRHVKSRKSIGGSVPKESIVGRYSSPTKSLNFFRFLCLNLLEWNKWVLGWTITFIQVDAAMLPD